jgi:hypothetical protein
MSGLISKLFDQEFTVIAVQLSILLASVYMLVERPLTVWPVFSIVIILCLLSLQVVSRRFLMFYPVRKKLRVPTPSYDTYILRYSIMLSLAALFTGLLQSEPTWRTKIVASLFGKLPLTAATSLSIIAFVLFMGLPTYWMVDGRNKVKADIAQKITAQSLRRVEIRKCPCSNDDAPHCQKVTKRLLPDSESVEIVVECEKCDYKEKTRLSAMIAY